MSKTDLDAIRTVTVNEELDYIKNEMTFGEIEDADNAKYKEELKNLKAAFFPTEDVVNHPQHYISKGGIETINVIDAWTEGLEGIVAVDTANVIKYISRWHKKNGIEDLEKAQWYLNHLIKHCKEDSED